MAMVDQNDEYLNILKQAKLLGCNRTSLYYKAVPIDDEEYRIKGIIDELYIAHSEYGYRAMTIILNRDYDIHINRKRTCRYMR